MVWSLKFDTFHNSLEKTPVDRTLIDSMDFLANGDMWSMWWFGGLVGGIPRELPEDSGKVISCEVKCYYIQWQCLY